MKIVADENIPGVEALFGAHGEVRLLPGRAIARQDVRDADILLVRSVTRVDETLLRDTSVRFVGSATIGTDHLDLAGLREQGVAVANAPGCNAEAVVDYVVASLCRVRPDWLGEAVGIVGCGNVGGRLYQRLRALGVACRCYDPFLSPEMQPDLCTFPEVLEANILCLHTPLTRAGPYPTHYLFDARTLARLGSGSLLLNAGRGAVVDNGALLEELQAGRISAVLDVWEGEPAIDPALLRAVSLGTPHIAGYSLEGRVRGTLMVYRAWCEWAGLPVEEVKPEPLIESLGLDRETVHELPGRDWRETVLAAYDPAADHESLLAAGRSSSPAAEFDRLRREYPWRREFSRYRVIPTSDALARRFRALGFRVR